MKNLIVIGHPDKNSFCYNGIFNTIQTELAHHNEEIEIIDLYDDDLSIFLVLPSLQFLTPTNSIPWEY